MRKCIGDCSLNGLSSYQLSKRAERLLKDAKDLKDKNFQEIVIKPTPGGSVGLPVDLMVGRLSELKQLHKLCADDEVSIIGIYGMGGVGKTMLLEKIYSEFQRQDTRLMYWVNMDSCHDIEDAQKAIVDELKLQLNENEKQDPKVLSRRIYGYLQNKKFVLVLANVWKQISLHKVGIPPAATSQHKFKVILTTQLEYVCDQMKATKLKVKCLGQEAAWTLFRETVGDSVLYSDPWVTNDAQKLVQKCGGLPLALVSLGRAMACKRTPKSWRLAIKQLDFAPWEITYMKEELLRCLKPSYDNLDNDTLKTCFSYCCLFPANTLIYKESIICYCIGEGIIRDPFDDATDMFNEGDDLLATLNASSLLEESDDDSYIKMHPIIRALPSLIACEHSGKESNWLVQTQLGLREAPEVEKWRGAEKISLMNNNIKVLNDIPYAPSLTTLLMPYNKELEKICEGFFRSMRNLRVLDLSYTSVKEIPAEIGELDRLLYLDCSGTKLSSLPQELGKLVRLRALLLSRTPELTHIPEGLIPKLSELRLLSMYISYENWKVDSLGHGVEFEELHCLKQLKVLGISVNTVSAMQKLAESYRLTKSIRELEIRLSPGLTELSTADLIWECKALKWLRLYACSDLEKLEIDTLRSAPSGDPNDNENEERSTLPNLTDLYLIQLPIAKLTWRRGYLENLSLIEITACREMRELIHCEDKSIIIHCEDKSIIEVAEEKEDMLQEINILPKLKRLNLSYLPKLESLSCGKRPLAFPSLEVLDVKDCPKLKKLPLNANKLRQIRGQKLWWNRLEWPTDDNKYKFKFQPYFKASYRSTSLNYGLDEEI